ncbi:MAG: CopG family transcriptional regulator [Deltaproteobacteria bacterium]|nr:CopG family transcriptional regulator [Deltaproteobacteria bacterium]MBW2413857.1 CopG family transcriptional regulator [Deltaproteobacteria bacterium]
MPDSRVTIKIPRALYHRIRDSIADSGFSSATEFIVYVLRDLVAERGNGDGDELSRDELRAIRTRLRNLGYLPQQTASQQNLGRPEKER